MDDGSPGPAASPTAPERAGAMLREARERQGLSLTEIAARTRVPMRHLQAIEADDYAGLPSPTYATGFARAYARAVGADEVAVARDVRAALAGVTRPQREYIPYEATDPARVPSRGLALATMALAILVAVAAGIYFATDWFRGSAPSAAPAPAVAAAPPKPVAAPTPAGKEVLVTATDEVWVRLYDAENKVIHQGVLQAGERFDVPADANDPKINVGRPDKLTITINGSQVQGLNLGDRPIKNVRVSADALLARAAGQTTPAAPAQPDAGTAPAMGNAQ